MIYRSDVEQSLHAYVFEPARARKNNSAILLFHGGGWSEGEPDWVFAPARRFSEAGLVAIPIEYRLAHGEVTPIESLSDVCAAFQWAREHARELQLNPARVAGYGVSAGGHLLTSTVTVGCPPTTGDSVSLPDAILLLSPALDVANDTWFARLLHGRGSAADYSPLDHVRLPSAPTSIVNGAADTLTPLPAARRYCEQLSAKGVRCEVNVFDGLGHLLTRNLSNQESEYDPDPEARAQASREQIEFLRSLGFID
jgi:acetyl esterase/lipase